MLMPKLRVNTDLERASSPRLKPGAPALRMVAGMEDSVPVINSVFVLIAG
jgi:hypothetical protein